MAALDFDYLVLRYCRQIIMQAMDHIRSTMREENLSAMRCQIADPHVHKSEFNQTKAIDRQAEDLILASLQTKFAKLPGVKAYIVFSEELGIKTFPEGASDEDADLVVFVDPIDGTEFVETLQGGWSLIAVYDRRRNDVICAVAGDIFLDRLYWASQSGYAECLDFVTHSWFRLDGGTVAKHQLAGARVNVLTTKVDRYRALSEQTEGIKNVTAGANPMDLKRGIDQAVEAAVKQLKKFLTGRRSARTA